MRILVTGGCGFIGSNFIRYILQHYKPAYVTNVDVLTYAGNLANLDGVVEEHGERYEFFKADIANADQMDALMTEHQFAAQFHPHQRHRNERAAGLRAPPRRPALHPDLNGRGVWLSWANREIHRAIATRSQFAVFSKQSRRRSSGNRFLQDLRPGRAGHAMLEQLWPVSVPGKINPAHDH